MKLHYFEQSEADNDDIMLEMAKAQGYVIKTCLLGGITVMEEVKNMRNPCHGCHCDRDKCGSTVGEK